MSGRKCQKMTFDEKKSEDGTEVRMVVCRCLVALMRKKEMTAADVSIVKNCAGMFPTDLSKTENYCCNQESEGERVCVHKHRFTSKTDTCPYSELWLALHTMEERARGGEVKKYWTCRFRDAPNGCVYEGKPYNMHQYKDDKLVLYRGFYCPYDHSADAPKPDCPQKGSCRRKDCRFDHPTEQVSRARAVVPMAQKPVKSDLEDKEEAFVVKPQNNAKSESKIPKCKKGNTCRDEECQFRHTNSIEERKRLYNEKRNLKRNEARAQAHTLANSELESKEEAVVQTPVQPESKSKKEAVVQIAVQTPVQSNSESKNKKGAVVQKAVQTPVQSNSEDDDISFLVPVDKSKCWGGVTPWQFK